MNIIEQSIILYYADYLSLKNSCTTVTDNCKYYWIQQTPINSAYICKYEPFYDVQNQYYIQAYTEYQTIKESFNEDGINSFLGEIGYLSSAGIVDAIQILKCIHRYSTKQERRHALRKYNQWVDRQMYTHIVYNDDGDPQREECTRYVAYSEQNTASLPRVDYTKKTSYGSELSQSSGSYKQIRETPILY